MVYEEGGTVNDAAAAVTETDGFASMSFVPSDLKPRQTSARLVLSTRGGRVVKSVLDSSFRYTPSSQTDVRKTFERIRREQQAENRQEQHTQIHRAAPVSKD
jgi:hypothetical protein